MTVLLVGFADATGFTDGKGKTNPKNKVEKNKVEKKKEDAESVSVGEAGSATKKPNKKLALYSPDTSNLEDAADSTYNSVNKYNFIFYFIYKYKYDVRAESLRSFLD